MKGKVAVLGAGITGVSLGSFLADSGYSVSVLEKTNKVGGMASSFKHKSHTLDFGPHKIYSQIPGIIDEFHRIAMPSKLLKVEKKNSLHLMGKNFDFPVKIPQIVLGINPIKSGKLGVGFGLTMTRNMIRKPFNRTYEDYFVSGFGRPAYNLLFRDLAWKMWGDPQELSEELGRKRVPVPNVFEMLKSGSGKDSTGKEISAKHFYYPKYGGIGFISEKYASHITRKHGEVMLETLPTRINLSGKKAVSVTYTYNKESRTVPVDFIANTIYLKDFLSLFNPTVPKTVMKAASGLKYRALILVFIVVNKPRVMKDNWVFFPEKDFIFNRISEHNSFSRFVVEKGKAVITAEMTTEYGSDLYNSSDDYIFRRVIEGLEKAGILEEKEIEEFLVKKAGRVYPVYDLTYRKNLKVILDYLDTFENVITLGRQGLYNYNNTDHCIDMSLKACDYIEGKDSGKKSVDDWKETRAYFDEYRIVD